MNDKRKRRTEAEIAEAAAVYLENEGDVDKAKKALKGWGKKEILRLEGERHWPLLLVRVHQRTNELLVEDDIKRRVDHMVRLRNLRIKLYRMLVPTDQAEKAINGGTAEGVAAAFCKVVDLEREISGDKQTLAPTPAGIFIFLKEQVLGKRPELGRDRFDFDREEDDARPHTANGVRLDD